MQKVQESKIKMARATSGILEINNEIVSRIPGLVDAALALNGLVKEAVRYSQGQMLTGEELTARKKEVREALVLSLLKVRSGVAAFATVSVDPEIKKLKEKYQGADSDVKKMREIPLFSYAYVVYGDASPIAAQLEPFVSEAEVVELKDLADNFNVLLPQKRTQLSKSSLSTRNLEEAIVQIDLLLADTIDVLVKPLEYKEPDFFKAYSNARIIVNSATRKSKGTIEKPNLQA